MVEKINSMRLDKWLWAARFFKTRALATEAVNGGKVHRAGKRVKPSQAVQVSDALEITRGQYSYSIHVDGLMKQRGPASIATTLYTETAESILAREKLADELRLHAAQNPIRERRPDKRSRRRIIRFTRKQES
ncbi:MAG: RNA-binding protein [Sulfuriflexus sp.]|nr:RNA-binding protein [Sulfuriflexus sp.]